MASNFQEQQKKQHQFWHFEYFFDLFCPLAKLPGQDVEAPVSSIFHWRSVDPDIMPSKLVSGAVAADASIHGISMLKERIADDFDAFDCRIPKWKV